MTAYLKLNVKKAVFLAGMLLTLPMATFAQEAEEAPKDLTLMDMFLEPSAKGVVMWMLLVMSICTVSFVVELFIKLRTAKLSPPAVLAMLRDAFASGNYQAAIEICNANPCFLSNTLAPVLENLGQGREGVEQALAENFNRQAVRLKSHNNYLSVIGVVAPMVGLTGTVLGMMKAFAVLGRSGVANMTGLSAAISEVLIATATGLMVAIPAFVFFYVFKNRTTVVLADVHADINSLLRTVPFEQLQGWNQGHHQG